MTATCETCRWWTTAGESPVGLCRRYPPTVIGRETFADTDFIFPRMAHDDYCGEHQPRQPAEAEAPKSRIRPRINPETRRVLEWLIEAAAAAHDAYGKLPSDHNGDPEYHALQDALDRARAHLAKLDGGDHG